VTFTAVLLLVYRLIQTLVPLMLMRLLDLLHVDKDKEQYSYQFVSLRVQNPPLCPSEWGFLYRSQDDGHSIVGHRTDAVVLPSP